MRGLVLGIAAALASCAGGAADSTGGETTSASTSSGGETSGSATTDETTTGTSGGVVGWETVLKVGTDHGAFLSVWGRAPDEVYAVGGQILDGSSVGMVYVHDGATWSEVALPAATPSLNWVTGVEEDVWVVGYEGAALRREGGEFVAHPVATASMLWGIWGASSTDLWAVGGDGVDDAPILFHWDGASWSPAAIPTLDEGCHGLFKVWGSAADDVMVVGDFGVTLHWDGASWSQIESGSITDLISVWGKGGPDAMVAVGGRANGRIARWDGAAWTALTTSLPGLSGVWVDSEGGATAVGWQGTIVTIADATFDTVAEESGTIHLLHATFGFDGGPRYAVGGSLQGPPPYVGVILRSEE
ncbi:MAG: hypothetical protein R3B09_15750 [Nannocystaceae bacterium]